MSDGEVIDSDEIILDPVQKVIKRNKDERRQALKLMRKPLDPRDPRLLSNCRIDSDPPPLGTTLDVGYGFYNPTYEAS